MGDGMDGWGRRGKGGRAVGWERRTGEEGIADLQPCLMGMGKCNATLLIDDEAVFRGNSLDDIDWGMYSTIS